jgi:hypothetical protein
MKSRDIHNKLLELEYELHYNHTTNLEWREKKLKELEDFEKIEWVQK